jgi:hypothetical protein
MIHIFMLEPFSYSVFCRSHWTHGQSMTVFARSNTGIVGSNPTQGMDVYVPLFCLCAVLCGGSSLATG